MHQVFGQEVGPVVGPISPSGQAAANHSQEGVGGYGLHLGLETIGFGNLAVQGEAFRLIARD